MTRFSVCLTFLISALFGTAALQARPLLSNSQSSHASACLEELEPPDRLVEICNAALSGTGASASQRVDMKVALAEAHNILRDSERAERLVKEVLDDAPTNARAHTILGWIQWRRGDYAEAEASFSTSIGLGPTASALAGLAASGRRAQSMTPDEAIVLLDAALAMSPDYDWAMREKGWVLMDRGDSAAAEPVFRAALEIDANNPWTLYALGYALNDLYREDDALDVLNRAAEMEDVPTGVFDQRSLAHLMAGNYKRALNDSARVIKEWPDRSEGYVRMARTMSALGRRQEGVDVLERYVESDFSTYPAFWLASLLHDDDQYERALDVLDRIDAEATAGYHEHELRAVVLLDMGRDAEAVAASKAALELRADATYPRYYLARLHVRQGDFDKGEAMMLEALEAGLSRDLIDEFLSELARKGEFVRMVQWRVRARDAAAD